jgi:hypothetical protein
MTTANFERARRAFCRRVPFAPFLVELVSGFEFTVTHPEAISLRGDVLMFTDPSARHRLFDSNSVCQLYDPEAR